MKVLVTQLSEDSWHSTATNLQQPIPFELDAALGLQKNYASICDLLKVPPTERDLLVLQLEPTKQYIDRDAIFGAVFGGPATAKVHTLVLRRKPTLRAQELVKLLSNEEGGKEKDVVFHMRYALADSDFAESFIEQSGVGALLDLVSRSKGNTQTYALHALRQCMEYVSGMAIVMSTPHLVKELFTLVDSPVVGVQRTALELLFVMCGYAKESGFTSVHRAAKATATGAGKEPYANVIALLAAGGDLETMVNAFTLLNVLLMTCPESKAEKLFRRWERLNLNDRLRTLTEIQHQQFQVQLEIYEETTGVNLRTRASRLDAQCRQLKAKLREYEQQQALVVLLREELRRIQHFVSEAWNDGTLISSAPMKRYLGPAQPEYPADLSFLKTAAVERERATELAASNTKISQQLQTLQTQYTKVTEQLEDYKTQLDTLSNASALLAAAQEQLAAARAAHTEALTEANAERETLNMLLQGERTRALQAKNQYEHLISEMSMDRDRLFQAVESLQQGTAQVQASINAASSEVPQPVTDVATPSTPITLPEVPAGAEATSISPSSSPSPAPEVTLPLPLSIDTTAVITPDSTLAAPDAPAAPAPPPGPAPPPPPPPPAAGGIRSIKPNKPQVTPNAKMKPLYWKRLILPQITRPPCIWDEVTETQFSHANLEEKFALKPPAEKPQTATPVASDKPVSVLDVKRSNAIAFMIAKLPAFPVLKSEPTDLVNTLSVVKNFTLEYLARANHSVRTHYFSLPTPEEVTGVRSLADAPGGADIKFDKPERFILDLFAIPKMREIVDCWLFHLEFADSTRALQSNVDTIIDACKISRSSSGLRKVLGTVLAVGNYMNGGTARGQADGFTIDALDSMATTKDATNTTTLLDFVCSIVCTRYGIDLPIDLEKELTPLGAAKAGQPIEGLRDELNALQKKTARARTLMESALPELPPSHAFVLTLPGALSTAEKILSTIAIALKKAETDFASVLEYFGYTKSISADCKTTTFFGWIYSFVQLMAKYSEKEKLAQASLHKKDEEMTRPKSDRFGKKIAQGQDPLAALANAIKLGSQMTLRNNSRKSFAVGGPGEKQLPPQ